MQKTIFDQGHVYVVQSATSGAYFLNGYPFDSLQAVIDMCRRIADLTHRDDYRRAVMHLETLKH